MTALSALSSPTALAADKPETVTLDFAYYNPVSLLLKEKGWVEEAFAKEGITEMTGCIMAEAWTLRTGDLAEDVFMAVA